MIEYVIPSDSMILDTGLRLGDPQRDLRMWMQAQRMIQRGWTLPALPRELVREAPRGDG